MKAILLIVTILSFQFLNAQFIINIGKNNYYESKVFLEDGTVKEGYLLEFGDKKVMNFAPILIANSFASSETRFGLSDKYFYFRKTEKSDEEKIPFTDIKRIERKEFKPKSDEFQIVAYEKLKLIMYDNKLKKDMEVPEFMAPVKFTNGKISVFGFIESQCTGNGYNSCNVAGIHYYFKRTDRLEGVKPTNFTYGNFLTITKLTDKYYLSFELLGENCPQFLKYLKAEEAKNREGFQHKFVDLVKKIYRKELTDTYKDEYKAKLKKAKKEMKKDAYEKYEAEIYQDYVNDSGDLFYDELFNEMVIQYINSSCE